MLIYQPIEVLQSFYYSIFTVFLQLKITVILLDPVLWSVYFIWYFVVNIAFFLHQKSDFFWDTTDQLRCLLVLFTYFQATQIVSINLTNKLVIHISVLYDTLCPTNSDTKTYRRGTEASY